MVICGMGSVQCGSATADPQLCSTTFGSVADASRTGKHLVAEVRDWQMLGWKRGWVRRGVNAWGLRSTKWT